MGHSDSPPPMREQLIDCVLRIKQLEEAMFYAGVEVPPWPASVEKEKTTLYDALGEEGRSVIHRLMAPPKEDNKGG